MWGVEGWNFPVRRSENSIFLQLDFRGKKGEGGFFRAYIRSTEEERLFEEKTHECISHTSPGDTFSERDRKCTQAKKGNAICERFVLLPPPPPLSASA